MADPNNVATTLKMSYHDDDESDRDLTYTIISLMDIGISNQLCPTDIATTSMATWICIWMDTLYRFINTIYISLYMVNDKNHELCLQV